MSSLSGLNYYEACQELYFGSTEETLGPKIVNSSLEKTTSPVFKVGYQAAADLRGVSFGADPDSENIAIIDFNSLNNGTNDYDSRILSFAGEAGQNGRGTLIMNANEFQFNGNSLNVRPNIKIPGQLYYETQAQVPSNLQGRAYDMQEVVWNGFIGTSPNDPIRTIQLRSAEGTPLFGIFDVAMSNGYGGGGEGFIRSGWVISKNAVPPSGLTQTSVPQEGQDLARLYTEIQWNNVSQNPEIRLYNKNTSGTAIYVIKGLVFPENDGW